MRYILILVLLFSTLPAQAMFEYFGPIKGDYCRRMYHSAEIANMSGDSAAFWWYYNTVSRECPIPSHGNNSDIDLYNISVQNQISTLQRQQLLNTVILLNK